MQSITSLLKPSTPAFKKLEIRLDTPNVYITTSSTDDGLCPPSIRGRVILMTHQELLAKEVRITLRATRRIQWYTDAAHPQRVRNNDIITTKESRVFPPLSALIIEQTHRIESGNHVWPFEIDLEPDSIETVSGMWDNYVAYTLEATVVAAGYLKRNFSVSRPFKVIRIIEDSALDVIEPEQIRTGTWEDKLHYQISTSPSSHPWGQPIAAYFNISQLSKKIKIDKIALRFLEIMELRAFDGRRELFNQDKKVVTHVEALSPNNPDLLLDGEQNIDGAHLFKVDIMLPKSLRYCRQSVLQSRIRLKHRLCIDLHASDDNGVNHAISHEFEYFLAIPSSLTFDEYDNVHLDLIAGSQRDATGLHKLRDPPPAFEDHHKDPIFYPDLLSWINPTEGADPARFDHSQAEQHILLCTTTPTGLTFPFMAPKAPSHFNPPEPLQDLPLHCVPSYETALSTPEVYTEYADHRPAYNVD
ncbi:hypothetical protein BU24DRAFT_446563 [Aaosphaeria arxii CBS 175.79]|uniref:Uncharacterized protein n=1 Tax=Aaosphaeria arxii CBS 175.79 TaxID=1450172 RepID=A0A6A5YAG3_9PLEO|nr:uncharacterized protein BU24DRAFT_446563 [Aaosphaeria arxii CBS 175.79]KAF2021574.1 hypothetical protein BU24DRAFT_446563 [Aaosphaeria arxii CBS 175.79]